MSIPLIGLTSIKPNKITFLISDITVIAERVAPYAAIPVEFATTTITFQVPGIGDIEKTYSLFMEFRDGAARLKVGRAYIPGQGLLFSDVCRVLWKSPTLQEAFAKVSEEYEVRFQGVK